ncbi:3714_t:CDS:2 [Ambispora gerdemannii]|uniref:3714_t:CDS:1 n=1 Tax=Ambispora gerdemannii TaxID=144530 RepID=A0A9N9BHB1_9GLOM|nr:3714_t:CDS:2 [Ambispora gerdemannii]
MSISIDPVSHQPAPNDYPDTIRTVNNTIETTTATNNYTLNDNECQSLTTDSDKYFSMQ